MMMMIPPPNLFQLSVTPHGLLIKVKYFMLPRSLVK